ncbi:DNA transformation protein [[Haemophilus] felis]|nr:DNA transformation protein [[Haemophilus] felis]NBI42650.1 DNA transformation protein [[Haemophilus] felis]
MTKTELATLEIRQALFELIGEVKAKTLFASYGLFSGAAMFGIYQNGNLYIKAEKELAEELIAQGAVNYISHLPNIKLSISNYYYLPQEIISNKEKYKDILLRSIAQINEKASLEYINKYRRIKDLPNLSMKYERLLSKVGIEELSLFRTLGASHAFARLVRKGITSELNMLWLFAAALKYKHVSLLTEQEKENALKMLNLILEQSGMKPMK